MNYTTNIQQAKAINKQINNLLSEINNNVFLSSVKIKGKNKKSKFGGYEYSFTVEDTSYCFTFYVCVSSDEPITMEMYTKWLKHRVSPKECESIVSADRKQISDKIHNYLNKRELNIQLTAQLNNNKQETKKALKI